MELRTYLNALEISRARIDFSSYTGQMKSLEKYIRMNRAVRKHILGMVEQKNERINDDTHST